MRVKHDDDALHRTLHRNSVRGSYTVDIDHWSGNLWTLKTTSSHAKASLKTATQCPGYRLVSAVPIHRHQSRL